MNEMNHDRSNESGMRDVTTVLANFVASLHGADLPVEVRDRVGLLAADAVAIAVRARLDVDSTLPLVRAVKQMGLSGGSCSVFGDLDTYTPFGAGLINGALIHSLDFDDTHAAAALHPSATVLAAAFTAAEMEGASGEDLIAAVVAGLEITIRLSKALRPADHYDRGFHPTATCGAFGAAAAASRIKKLSSVQVINAFGIVLSQTSGSMQFLDNGAWTKRFQVGNAAAAGLLAAALAKENYRGASRAIEGINGFLKTYAPAAVAQDAIAGLGSVWETLQIAIKPYPACRFAHAAMDAIIQIRNANNLKMEQVDQIVCGLSRKAIDLVGDPIETKRRASTTAEAQFSMPFTAVVCLMEGGMDWDSYSRHLGSDEVSQAMQKVFVEHDDEVEAIFPERFAGRVAITCTDGRRFESFVHSPKGEPDNFVTNDELQHKFLGLIETYLGTQGTELFAEIRAFESVNVGRVFSLSRPAIEL